MKPKAPHVPAVHVSRRDAIKGGAGLGAAGLLGCGSAGTESSFRSTSALGTPRVAIIGAGAGGISAAYFLAKDCAVTVFEAADHIGGHANNVTVTYQNQPLTVALGAEFFHPATHPLYTTLLEQLGLFNAANPGTNDQTIGAPGSINIFPVGGWFSTFSSIYPEFTPLFAVDFLIYAQVARSAVINNMSWDTTVADWVASISGVASSFKTNMVLPWLTSLIGSSTADAMNSSARSILQTFALAFPSNPLSGATTYNSKIGLQGNLQQILAASPGVQVNLSSAVTGLAFDGTVWTLTTANGSYGPFDAVIVNAPPQKSAGLLAPLPWAQDISAILGQYQFFNTRIVIHTDPAYMFWDHDFWAAVNAGTTNGECENSVWLGALLPKTASGGTVDVFKSWVNRRKSDPKNILAQGYYQHPHITAQNINAARALAGVQGRNGLYFSGTYTQGFDTQESAVYAAMKVAAQIAPQSATLASLNAALPATLQSQGLSSINYDL